MRIDRLRRFVGDMTSLVSGAWQDRDEAATLEIGHKLLADLVKQDDWLPETMGRGPTHGYFQNLLWCDPLERFSVVSFVWGPNARTPIHDHMMWGLVGMLRGSETEQRFVLDPATGQLEKAAFSQLAPGDVCAVVPADGDIHQVANALTDRCSISIHVYGGNIGTVRRHRWDSDTHEDHPFISGYSNRDMPNLWDRSAEVRAAG